MSYKCLVTGEEYNYTDEVLRVNYNLETSIFDEFELEVNGQNPDYCIGFIDGGLEELLRNTSISLESSDIELNTSFIRLMIDKYGLDRCYDFIDVESNFNKEIKEFKYSLDI